MSVQISTPDLVYNCVKSTILRSRKIKSELLRVNPTNLDSKNVIKYKGCSALTLKSMRTLLAKIKKVVQLCERLD